MPLIDIFRAGKRPDRFGQEYHFTCADLQQVADNYDPDFHEAPLVIGHPSHNHPAWGWVKALQVEGDILKAQVAQLDPDFAEMVQAGRFKKVSASFYLPDSPANPKQGVLMLRHVGFLGAMPPAVKGLKQVEFSDDEQGIVDFCDSEQAPCTQVHSEQPISTQPQQGEPLMTEEEIKAMQAENALLKAEKQRLEQEKAEQALNAVKQANADFAEGLVKEGKLAPVVKAPLLSALNNLAEINAGREPEFNEGEDILSQFKTALAASPVLLEFGEVADKEKVASQQTDCVEYAEGTDPASIEADKAIRQYMTEHNVDYTTAFNALYH